MRERRFAKYLKDILERKEWSQGKLARMAGISGATVSRCIAGKLMPTPATIQSMAEALGVGLDEMMSAAGYWPETMVRGALSRADSYETSLPRDTIKEIERVVRDVIREELQKQQAKPPTE